MSKDKLTVGVGDEVLVRTDDTIHLTTPKKYNVVFFNVVFLQQNEMRYFLKYLTVFFVKKIGREAATFCKKLSDRCFFKKR